MTTFVYGQRVRIREGAGPLGVLAPGGRLFLEGVEANHPDEGEVLVPPTDEGSSHGLPDGWMLVDVDGKGLCPVHPGYVEPVACGSISDAHGRRCSRPSGHDGEHASGIWRWAP